MEANRRLSPHDLSPLQDLAVRTKALSERAHEIQTTGLTGPYERAFRDLEEKLAQAQGIVNTRNATAIAVTTLMELIEDLRYSCSVVYELIDSHLVIGGIKRMIHDWGC